MTTMVSWLDFLDDFVKKKKDGKFKDDSAVLLQYFKVDSVEYSGTWDGEQIVVLVKDEDADNATVFLDSQIRVKRYSKNYDISDLPKIYITEQLSSSLDSCTDWDWTIEEYSRFFDSIEKDYEIELKEVKEHYEEKIASMKAEHFAVQKALSFASKAARKERNSMRDTLDKYDRTTGLIKDNTVSPIKTLTGDLGTNDSDSFDRAPSGGSRSISDGDSITSKEAKVKDKEEKKKKKKEEKKKREEERKKEEKTKDKKGEKTDKGKKTGDKPKNVLMKI